MGSEASVLSLFDGMSCGQIALGRAGISCQYFASEIDQPAIYVTQDNYPNTKQLGDVASVKAASLPKIDLLIGGSPCQGFSISGSQLNFDDSRSKLFFEFVRLLEECQPRYFLLENVVMKREFLDRISGHLGVKPVLVDSALVSAQSRQRYYWTNIPFLGQPEDMGICLKDVFEPGLENSSLVVAPAIPGSKKNDSVYVLADYKQKKNAPHCVGGFANEASLRIGPPPREFRQGYRVYSEEGKSITLSSGGGGLGGRTGLYRVGGVIRKLSRLECERLQTVPEGYTKAVNDSQAVKMLGNGWTVDVIAHFLKNIS